MAAQVRAQIKRLVRLASTSSGDRSGLQQGVDVMQGLQKLSKWSRPRLCEAPQESRNMCIPQTPQLFRNASSQVPQLVAKNTEDNAESLLPDV